MIEEKKFISQLQTCIDGMCGQPLCGTQSPWVRKTSSASVDNLHSGVVQTDGAPHPEHVVWTNWWFLKVRKFQSQWFSTVFLDSELLIKTKHKKTSTCFCGIKNIHTYTVQTFIFYKYSPYKIWCLRIYTTSSFYTKKKEVAMQIRNKKDWKQGTVSVAFL